MRQLVFEQMLPGGIEQVWRFFSDPRNLAKITPPGMNFSVTSDAPDRIYPGLIITYKVSPLLGIPVNWVTEITQVQEPFYFIDEQRSGPYAIWHHEHRFREVNGGVLMTDRLFYKVPGGPVGNLLDLLMIHGRVKQIFEYRTSIIEAGKLF